ncbi:MAG: gamma-glutamylcyclotransferase family protein [Sediminicola sp.]
MNSIVLLFSYGTLQDTAVQLQLFQRKLHGFSDTLYGYRLVPKIIEATYHAILPSPDSGALVKGVVYELFPNELSTADLYEGPQYIRTRVSLSSGKKAWAYIGIP